MDTYLRKSLKKSAALQPPPHDGKLRLLRAAAKPTYPGIRKRFIGMLFPGIHPLEKAHNRQMASLDYFDSTMVWAFRSGLVNLRFFF